MEQEIISVYTIGVPKCEHEYVYDKPVKVCYTFPPVVTQFRICECCGKAELVTSKEVFEFDVKKINELTVKYGRR